MFCHECGSRYESEKAKFCAECGISRQLPPQIQSKPYNPTTKLSNNSITSHAIINSNRSIDNTKCRECSTVFTSPEELFCGNCGKKRVIAVAPKANEKILQHTTSIPSNIPSGLYRNESSMIVQSSVNALLGEGAVAGGGNSGNGSTTGAIANGGIGMHAGFNKSEPVIRQSSSNSILGVGTAAGTAIGNLGVGSHVNAGSAIAKQASLTGMNTSMTGPIPPRPPAPIPAGVPLRGPSIMPGNSQTNMSVPKQFSSMPAMSVSSESMNNSCPNATGLPQGIGVKPSSLNSFVKGTQSLSASMKNMDLGTSTISPPSSVHSASLSRMASFGSTAGVRVSLNLTANYTEPDALMSIDKRRQITKVVNKNMTNPLQNVNDYFMTKEMNISVFHSQDALSSSQEQMYQKNLMDGDFLWEEKLRYLRQTKQKFTDADFLPNLTSIYSNVNKKRLPQLEQLVTSWKRLSETSSCTAYVQITMYEDKDYFICGETIKSQSEAMSMIDIITKDVSKQAIDQKYFKRALSAVQTGLEMKKKEHLLLLTTTMIKQMSEYVGDGGIQRFDQLWKMNLVDNYQPRKYIGLGTPYAYRLGAEGTNYVNRVAVIVPINYSPTDLKLYSVNNINNKDIKNGKLGDAYLCGALSLLATSPSRIRAMFPRLSDGSEQIYNDEGIYAVRFWRNGKSRLVIIDDYIPCNQFNQPVFGRFYENEFWFLLIEKAYAKLNGSYESIAGGKETICLEDLIGCIPKIMSFATQGGNIAPEFTSSTLPLDKEKIWEYVKSAIQKKQCLGALCGETTPSYLGVYRACGVSQLVELEYSGKTVKLLCLRLPCSPSKNVSGSQESHGVTMTSSSNPWTKDDKIWEYIPSSEKQRIGFTASSDCLYWLTFEQFLCDFSSFLICIDYNTLPGYSYHSIYGSWKSNVTSGGTKSLHINPQYQLNTPQKTHVIIEVEQPSRRLTGEPNYKLSLGIYIASNAKHNQRKLNISTDLVASTMFVSERHITLELDLEGSPSPYVIIPAIYESSECSEYHLRVYTSGPSSILPIHESTVPICSMCEKPLTDKFRVVNNVSLCLDCTGKYRAQQNGQCAYCQQVIDHVPGQFSGKYYDLADGKRCHFECIDGYRYSIAEKCIECQQPVLKVEGQFSGQYYTVNEGTSKCHSECYEMYQMRNAKRCAHCMELILKTGPYSGAFYELGDQQVIHSECLEAYQYNKAEKCGYCYNPILKIEGKYDGRFYEISTGGKIHYECWQSYQASQR